MTTLRDYFIDFFKNAVVFFYINKYYIKYQPITAYRDGNRKGKPVLTGKPERKYPLEATIQDKLEGELGSDLPGVTIHSGGNSQQILSAAGLWALALGSDIFIREEAYKDGSMETDKILLHEMVHVLQHKRNMRITTKEEREKAEAEAEQAEQEVFGDLGAEPGETIEMDGKKYRITGSEKKKIVFMTADSLMEWIEARRYTLRDEEFLELLLNLKAFHDRRYTEPAKTPWEAMRIEIEDEFRKRLNF